MERGGSGGGDRDNERQAYSLSKCFFSKIWHWAASNVKSVLLRHHAYLACFFIFVFVFYRYFSHQIFFFLERRRLCLRVAMLCWEQLWWCQQLLVNILPWMFFAFATASSALVHNFLGDNFFCKFIVLIVCLFCVVVEAEGFGWSRTKSFWPPRERAYSACVSLFVT